jgi:hypothetical protein
MGDFQTYQRAAKRAVAGEPIYRLQDPHALLTPVVTFLFFPLAVLPTWGKFCGSHSTACFCFDLHRSLAVSRGLRAPGFQVLVLLLLWFIDTTLGTAS